MNSVVIDKKPIDPILLLVQSLEKQKIARQGCQAISVDGVGRNLNPSGGEPGRSAIPMIFEQKPPLGSVSFEGITYFE